MYSYKSTILLRGREDVDEEEDEDEESSSVMVEEKKIVT